MYIHAHIVGINVNPIPEDHADLLDAAVLGGELVQNRIGWLMLSAAQVSAEALVRRLSAAISRSDQAEALKALRAAFTARGSADDVSRRLAALDIAEADLATWNQLVDAASDIDVIEAQAVDVVCPQGQDAGMTRATGSARVAEPRKKTGKAWERYVRSLGENKDDAQLIELASSSEFAGSQGALSELSGLTVESISRAKNGHRRSGFSDTSRDWFVAYLLNPKEPPPRMEARPGPKARAGAIAPQVWVDTGTHTLFLAQAEKLGSQGAVLDFCILTYLEQLSRRRTVPQVEIPRGTEEIRTRIPPEILKKLDDKVGVAARADHLRAALAIGLPKLAENTAKPEFVASHA